MFEKGLQYLKGTKQKIIIIHNPSEIDQNHQLLVRFPNLGNDDVIVPGTVNLSFNNELSSKADPNRTLVQTWTHGSGEMYNPDRAYWEDLKARSGLRNVPAS